MKILALEFSAELRSAAVRVDAAPPVWVQESWPREEGAINLIEQALCQARLEREAIDCLAVGLGPGSYTGIRVAIALAQGWQMARGVRLLGVSSMEVMAAQAQAQGERGAVNFVVDAQRGEVYWARYELDDAGCRVTHPLRLVVWRERRGWIDPEEPLFGPDRMLADQGVRRWIPCAGTLAGLAIERRDDLPPENLEPIYLRATTFVKAPPPRVIPPLPVKSTVDGAEPGGGQLDGGMDFQSTCRP